MYSESLLDLLLQVSEGELLLICDVNGQRVTSPVRVLFIISNKHFHFIYDTLIQS